MGRGRPRSTSPTASGAGRWRRATRSGASSASPRRSSTCCPTTSTGLDAIELGCGTGYVSAWLARRGARPVGIDNSPKQLETATRLQREHGIDFPLLLGNAERVPYPDASFDFAISEYGAALWADPYAWIPEAARLLRPGGRLMFLTNHLLAYPHGARPRGRRARRRAAQAPDVRHAPRSVWPDEPDSVEFHLSHGDWIRLLRANGFEVEDLVEIQAPEGATTTYDWMSPEWARQWPCEEAWKVAQARLTGARDENGPAPVGGRPA